LKILIGLAHRAAYALALSLTSFVACTMPVGLNKSVQTVLCVILDWPIAMVGRFVPQWRVVDVFRSSACDLCTPADLFLPHVGLGVVIYVGLFYAPNVVLWVVRRGWGRGGVGG